ncbi:MAG: ABC transporter permease [Symbiobacterium sp.]|uniref:ABC transporter permease n=1 Tax=Symbiobacterium sp. TaxID=1971213 RepID=UPI003464A0BA
MRNLWLVTRREFLTRIRSGAFITSTVLMMVTLFAVTAIPYLMEGGTPKPLVVTVVDRTGRLLEPLREAVAANQGSRGVEIRAGEGDDEELIAEARADETALLIIEGNYPGDLRARFLASSVRDLGDSGLVTGPLEELVRAARLAERGLPVEVAREVMEPLTVEELQLTADEERTSDQFAGMIFLVMGAIVSVYLITVMNSQFVFQGVLEEKVSRVVEVMAAAVRPAEMMAGKILGLGLLGVVQYLAVMVAWVAGNALTTSALGVPSGSITPGVALLIMLFIVLGYALNSSVLAALGATISRMEDSQTVVTPVLLLMMLPMFLIAPVFSDPSGPLATVLSFVPIWTPITMLIRVMLSDVPMAQVVTSVVLLAATTAILAWASGRIYRAALLTFGTRPSLKQLWQYLKAG